MPHRERHGVRSLRRRVRGLREKCQGAGQARADHRPRSVPCGAPVLATQAGVVLLLPVSPLQALHAVGLEGVGRPGLPREPPACQHAV